MKVLMIGTYPLGRIYGGVPTYTHKFAHYLSNLGNIELHILTFDDKNEEFKKDNLNIHVINKKLFPFFVPVAIRTLLKIARKINPDIIDIQGTHFPLPLIALLFQKRYPIVLTVLATVSKEKKYYEIGLKHYGTSPFQLLNLGLIEKYVASKIPFIVVETPSVKKMFMSWTKSKIYVVPDGIEYEKIQNIEIHDLNARPDIFFVGRLVKVKGVDILIRAIPLVMKKIPNITVYIAGSGPRENELKNLVAELNLEKQVKFLGFIPEEEKFKYYKASKIVVIPSRWENSPITLYEAMAAGKPVIGSNVGGIPDMIDDGRTGFIFESENVEDLANKIITLLEDENLRNEMGWAAKNNAKKYDWNNIVKMKIEIYSEIIFRRGSL